MAKTKSIFVCQSCGSQRSRWEGRCSDCGEWNTIVEELDSKPPSSGRGAFGGVHSGRVVSLKDAQNRETILKRISTGIGELDRVLGGGGLAYGSMVLLGGSPGVGKSTLLLQMVGSIQGTVMYVSGEESIDQTAHRAQRLKVKKENLMLASEGNLEAILKMTELHKPEVLVIDSIQTVYTSEIPSAPGTVSQVRECAGRLMTLSKTSGVTIILVGHVTKDGSLAGPKVLEHMVDTVLAFEGDQTDQYRLLRTLKNRFGAALELGVFAMGSYGLREVNNPSELFLEDRSQAKVGSAVFASMEGSRPLLCEIQALTVPSYIPSPRRTAVGYDINRLHLVIAILEKRLGLNLGQQDVFVNVVGGLKISEPAADLALAAALISSRKDISIPSDLLFFGELGLSGEVRYIPFIEQRIREGHKLGFVSFLGPKGASRDITIKNIKIKEVQKFRI